jgi:steroid 5-alpha reductase family enzyme
MFEKANECHVFYPEECWLEACWSGTKFNYWSHSEGRVFYRRQAGRQAGRWGDVVLCWTSRINIVFVIFIVFSLQALLCFYFILYIAGHVRNTAQRLFTLPFI